jgi:hypothetical protein
MAEHIKPLLAILFVHNRMEDYEVTEEEISKFINEQKLAIDNPLIREILSTPNGKIPKNLVNEDIEPTVPAMPNVPTLEELVDLDVIAS